MGPGGQQPATSVNISKYPNSLLMEWVSNSFWELGEENGAADWGGWEDLVWEAGHEAAWARPLTPCLWTGESGRSCSAFQTTISEASGHRSVGCHRCRCRSHVPGLLGRIDTGSVRTRLETAPCLTGHSSAHRHGRDCTWLVYLQANFFYNLWRPEGALGCL